MPKKDIQEELKHTLNLLLQEKEEDLMVYKRKMTGTSIHERRKQGVCWYPVALEKTNFMSGERLLVRVSRPPEHHDSHMFQSGKLVSLFSNAGTNNENSELVNGVVNQVMEHAMLITLNCSDVPAWIHDGLLGVQLLFDENAYREMEGAMKALINTKDERINYLKGVLLGNIEASFDSLGFEHISSLNHSQNSAVRLVLNARDVGIVHGPPGTGKTTTIVQAIAKVLYEEKQVMVCAPSNAAADLLVEKLDDLGLKVIRIGHPARVTEKILSLTLDAQVAQHRDYKELRVLRRKAEEYKSLGRKYKRSFGPAEREQRRLLLSEASKFSEQAENLEYYITNNLLSNAQVIACTLVGANNNAIKGMTFHTVFIDEAAQALEPACWIPIMKSQRVIFAGDHFQLPPTIKSYDAARGGLDKTLFEKAITRNKADIMLREQYRMHNMIMSFSADFFYKNQLFANERVAHWTVYPGDQPLEFIDTAGTGYFEQADPDTKSSFNKEEAHLLLRHFTKYIQKTKESGALDYLQSIGLISPYKAQVGLIQDLFEETFSDQNMSSNVSINTVDAFQGQERDVIYISLVRSNDKGEIGFLADTRRMNVAMTRARKKLVIIGDSGTIGNHDFYHRLLDYVNKSEAYRSAFEFLD